MGDNWNALEGYFHKFDVSIGKGILGIVVYMIWHHRPDFKRAQ